MGMYDDVKFAMKCPICGNVITNFQSKCGDCTCDMIDFGIVTNFYGDCDNCGTWFEFTREEIKHPLKDYTCEYHPRYKSEENKLMDIDKIEVLDYDKEVKI